LIQIGNFELFEIRNGINGRSGADYQKIPGILWRQIPFRPSPRRRFSPFLRDPLHYHRLVANFWFPGFVFVYRSNYLFCPSRYLLALLVLPQLILPHRRYESDQVSYWLFYHSFQNDGQVSPMTFMLSHVNFSTCISGNYQVYLG
jgi:hypothetical protein